MLNENIGASKLCAFKMVTGNQSGCCLMGVFFKRSTNVAA